MGLDENLHCCVVLCVIDSIADDILDSCVSDVVRELEQINGDIVDHIYNAEFSVVQ